MPSKFNLPEKKMSFKDLVGKKMTQNVKFMGVDTRIHKLSVSEVMAIQELVKNSSASDTEGFEVLKLVIRSGVEGAKDLADEDFGSFPMDELSRLSNDIMRFSGISGDQGK